MLIVLGQLGGWVAAPEHAPTFHVEYAIAMLVVHFPLGSYQAHVGFGAHGPRFQNFVFQAQGVVGQDRFFPLQVFKPRRP